MGPPMSSLSMPQYPTNPINTNVSDVHQASVHYDHLVQQSQHNGGYSTGFHNTGIMSPQNYTGSVHFQPTTVDYAKMNNDDYAKYTSDQLTKMTSSPPPPPPPSAPTSSLPPSMKSYSDHMNEANWNQMYGHHQVYGPPNEYSQIQQNYSNANSKYWS